MSREQNFLWASQATDDSLILVSVPHCGIFIPNSIKQKLQPEYQNASHDTDWFVDELYKKGAQENSHTAMIHATCSRYVVDLNRPVTGSKLYLDNRIESTVVPLNNFLGKSLYQDGKNPSELEINERLVQYYYPYHREIELFLKKSSSQKRSIVLLDAHSIRRRVPTIQKDPFADFMIGNNDGNSCDPTLSELVVSHFETCGFKTNFNNPFKGGHITRHYGNPQQGIHAIQIEMSQDLYMNEKDFSIDTQKSDAIKLNFSELLTKILVWVKNENQSS